MNTGPDIVTVTLNPAIDETVFLDQIRLGEVNRSIRHHRQAGGKGVNISSMLAQYGVSSIATGFLGRGNPRVFDAMFCEYCVHDEFIRIKGDTRTGIKLIDESTGQTTDINSPGLSPSAGDLAALELKIKELIRPDRWFVLAGSLPPGVSVDYFEGLLKLIRAGGARSAVDIHGPGLECAIACGVDLVKPNHNELAEVLGSEPSNHSALIKAAAGIQHTRIPHVILSLGSDGAFFAMPEGIYKVEAPPAEVASTAGAGDSMLAGYLAGLLEEKSATERAALSTVFAWCSLEDVNRRLPELSEIESRMKLVVLESISEIKDNNVRVG